MPFALASVLRYYTSMLLPLAHKHTYSRIVFVCVWVGVRMNVNVVAGSINLWRMFCCCSWLSLWMAIEWCRRQWCIHAGCPVLIATNLSRRQCSWSSLYISAWLVPKVAAMIVEAAAVAMQGDYIFMLLTKYEYIGNWITRNRKIFL